MEGERATGRLRRMGIDLGLLAAIGLFLALVGPYSTVDVPFWLRLAYWQVCALGVGGIGIVIDEVWGRRLGHPLLRVAAVSLAMTPFATLLVFGVSRPFLSPYLPLGGFTGLLFEVFVVALPLTAVRVLVWRAPQVVVRAPPPPSDAAFRKRLSAPRREARLIAVQAEDHYLRVHTDAGQELIGGRFSDALAELSDAKGFRIHRSWWVAADAIEAVRWRNGRGEARMAGGLTAPVSRTHARTLKAAGWF